MIWDLLANFAAPLAAKRFPVVRKVLWLIAVVGLLVVFTQLALAT